MKPAVRLSALMNIPAIWVYTHDSIGLGEDGPTHQPIEQLATLRATPNMTVFRPADANETAVGWRIALERRNPTALCAVPAGAAGARSVAHAGGRRRPGRLRAGGRRGSRGAADRHRLRGARGARGPRASGGARRHAAGWSRCRQLGAVRGAVARPIATRCCRRRSRPGSVSRPVRRWAGSATPARAGRDHRDRPVRRLRAGHGRASTTSASRPSRVADEAARVLSEIRDPVMKGEAPQ